MRSGTAKIEGAEVICRDKKTLTDNEGRFRIDAIPCGQCDLIIIKSGYDEYKKTMNLPEGKAGYDLGRIDLVPISTNTGTTESTSQTGKTTLQREQQKQRLVLPNK